jgi:WhiB family redox-sensing transcriptional regulator
MNLRDLLAPPSWHARANCRGLNPDLFYPVQGANQHQIAKCKAICGACVVRAECLNEALANHEPLGIFGGMTRDERRGEAHRRGITGRSGPKAVAACGTDSGYYRHVRHGEAACDDCKAAHSDATATRQRGRFLAC